MNNQQYFSRDELACLVPSAFQTQAHTRTSSKYTYIPTISVIDELAKEDWYVTAVAQQNVREKSRNGFQKHMLRLRQKQYFGTPAIVGEEVPELVLINSHDGSSCYELLAGLYRFVCTNGMVVTSAKLQSIKFRHTGNIVDDVIEGAYTLVKYTPEVLETIALSKTIMLTVPEQNAFAQSAIIARWGDKETGYLPEQINMARRTVDSGDDLWSTFNRVQENLTRGGFHGTKSGKNGKTRNVSAREVKGINSLVTLNQSLWALLIEQLT